MNSTVDAATAQGDDNRDSSRPLPLWLNPTYARHIVRGNFMTLNARPKTVERGEWIAHQGTGIGMQSERLETFELRLTLGPSSC